MEKFLLDFLYFATSFINVYSAIISQPLRSTPSQYFMVYVSQRAGNYFRKAFLKDILNKYFYLLGHKFILGFSEIICLVLLSPQLKSLFIR